MLTPGQERGGQDASLSSPCECPQRTPQPVARALLGGRRASRGSRVPVPRVGSRGEEPGATSVVSGAAAGLVRGLRSWAGPGQTAAVLTE